MYRRLLEGPLKKASKKYPLVSLVGPRQSGKTTLAKSVFTEKPYVSLENPQTLTFATEDPQGFLGQYPDGAILDEVQRAPSLFSYLQTIVDEKQREGLFVLTGSQNFTLMEKVTQSLAGRVSINRLMPFSLPELQKGLNDLPSLNTLLFTGGYPRIYDKGLSPGDWLGNYVETYLERDVRSLKNVGDLSSFRKFLRMCAARSGHLLNLSSLGNDCGVTHNTAKAWLSVLEAGFLVFLLQPHFKNFNKRLIKSPKLFFYDTGLLCYLLGISKAEELATHSLRGAIFETFVIGELMKSHTNAGLTPHLYFWQDKSGKEIDCLIEKGERLIAVEIKAGQTITEDYFRNLEYWTRLSKSDPADTYVVYAGKENQKRKTGRVLGWRNLDQLP